MSEVGDFHMRAHFREETDLPFLFFIDVDRAAFTAPPN